MEAEKNVFSSILEYLVKKIKMNFIRYVRRNEKNKLWFFNEYFWHILGVRMKDGKYFFNMFHYRYIISIFMLVYICY